MRRLIIACAAVSLCLVSGVGSGAAADEASPARIRTTPEQRVQAYVEPSIVYLHIEWTGYIWDSVAKEPVKAGKPFTVTSQCTGFVVNPDGYIATAGHCVDPREVSASFAAAGLAYDQSLGYYTDLTAEEMIEFEVYNVDANPPTLLGRRSRVGRGAPELAVTAVWATSVSGQQSGVALPARVLNYQPFSQGDAAILKVEETNLNPLLLNTDSDFLVGTDIVAVGYPGSVDEVTDADLSPTYTTGALGNEETVGNGLLKVFTIDAAISGGMSGGPTVDLNGRVMGTTSFRHAVESQQFNFIRPATMIEELLREEGVTNELGETATDYRAGLNAYFAGDKIAAVKALAAVVRAQPNNGLAQDYLNKARGLPNPPPPERGFPLLPVAGGLVLLALAGGLGYLLLRKRRRTPSAASPVASPAAAGMVVSSAGGPGFSAGTAMPQPSPTGATTLMPPQPPPSATNATQAASSDTATLISTPPLGSSEPGDGKPLEGPAQPMLGPAPHSFCGSCGTKAAAGQRFCGSCGTEL
jgi:serine protease Do